MITDTLCWNLKPQHGLYPCPSKAHDQYSWILNDSHHSLPLTGEDGGPLGEGDGAVDWLELSGSLTVSNGEAEERR